MSLDRFKIAQDSRDAGFDVAFAELRSGRKTSHWIWYVFPQLRTLGHSSTAKHFGIAGGGEACDYLRDEPLRRRLILAVETVAEQLDRSIPLVRLMGGTTDALKLVSSLTLFENAAHRLQAQRPELELRSFIETCSRILTTAAAQGFPRCSHTANSLADEEGRPQGQTA